MTEAIFSKNPRDGLTFPDSNLATADCLVPNFIARSFCVSPFLSRAEILEVFELNNINGHIEWVR